MSFLHEARGFWRHPNIPNIATSACILITAPISNLGCDRFAGAITAARLEIWKAVQQAGYSSMISSHPTEFMSSSEWHLERDSPDRNSSAIVRVDFNQGTACRSSHPPGSIATCDLHSSML